MAENTIEYAIRVRTEGQSALEALGLSLEKVIHAGLEPLAAIAPTTAGALEDMLTKAGPTAVALGAIGGAAVAGGVALYELTAGVAEGAAELERFSVRTGASVEDLSALKTGVELVHGSLGDVVGSFRFMG